MDGKSCVSVAIGLIAAYYTTTKQCCHYFRQSFIFVRTHTDKNSANTKQCCHYFRQSFIFVYVPDGHQKRVCNYLNRIWVVRISTMPADLFGRHLRRMRNSVAVAGFAKSA